MKKRILSMALVIVILITMLPSFTISSFAYTSGDFEYDILDDGTAEITGYNGTATELEIPSILGGYTVTSIGHSAFEECYNLENVTISDGVTSIGSCAFCFCENLTSITIPDSVISIGINVFYLCSALTSITVDSNNQYYSSDEYGALFNKEKTELVQYPIGNSRTSYTIPKDVKIIGYRSFCNCISIKNITIPNGVTTIGEQAFDGVSLESIVIPNSVTLIKYQSFICSLRDLYFTGTADDWVKIGIEGFAANPMWCAKNVYFNGELVTEVVLSDKTTCVDNLSFLHCKSLTSVTIPYSVTSISEAAFGSCSALTSINVDPNNQYYSSDEYGVLFNKEKTELVQYPIGSSRKSYTIPDGVTRIDEYAFQDCTSLTNITIPDSVTTIGGWTSYGAFYGCTSLTDVYYKGTQSQWDAIQIGDSNYCLTDATIHYNSCQEHVYGDWITTVAPTCEGEGSATRICSVCGNEEYNTIDPIEHDFIDRTCRNCGFTYDLPDILRNGWIEENGKWAYYEDDFKVTNVWKSDSKGWCYLGADGYCVTNTWKADSKGWCYLDANGRMVCNNWVYDGGKWYFMDSNGYMVSNTWKKDSKGWCYLGSSGAMLTNSWVKDSVGWCYVGANGYCVTNKWIKDSKGWCYLNSNGRMVYNMWVKDSKGWCYVGSSGYMVYNQWVKDGNNWYYIDANGYMVTGTKVINGKTYKFNSSGVWIE